MIIELSGSSGDFLGHRLVVKGNGRTEINYDRSFIYTFYSGYEAVTSHSIS